MRKVTVLLVCGLLVFSACRRTEEAPEVELPALDSRDLARAALSTEDMGTGWTEQETATPNTIQIAGDVGAANITNPIADATAAFRETAGPGFVSVSLFMVGSEDVAHQIIATHRQAADQKTWSQEREDGGTASFENSGTIGGLGQLGDELFSARLAVTITTGEGAETERIVEYVVFRNGPVVAFVVAQDAKVASLGIKEAEKIDAALAQAPVATPNE